MTRPKRVNPGELRYPARHASHSDDHNERHQSCIAWLYAKFELDYLYDLLIDLKSGHAARARSSITSDNPKWPLPTESEVRDCLQKTFIQDCALQDATKRLSHPYRRKYSPAMTISVRNTVYRSIREQIDDGISPDLQTPYRDLFIVVESHHSGLSPKTPEQYNQEMYIAVEIEEHLNRTERPDLKLETRRISDLVKRTPLAYNHWDQFLWSDFLDSVFTHSARFTIELAPTDLGPNKPSPRQKIGAPVVPDTQILRRIYRQTSRTVRLQIGHAFFSDTVIDDFLRHFKT